jgi:SNF2 family DNA or RNA helicase
VWGTTAKPTPNEPTDAWGQCRLVTPSTVPTYFKQFRDQVMVQRGPYKWEAKPHAADVVATVMQPSVRFRRDQCYDIREAIYETRHADMSPEQQKLYEELRRDLIAQYDSGQIKAFNQAVKLAKLVQISSGVVYGTTGQEIQIPCQPRLEVLDELIGEASAKVIIFAPFKCTISMLAHERRALGRRVGVIHGEVGKTERTAIFRDFQHGDLDELIAQPGAMAHGLTLTAADMIVWFAPVDSNEIYEQANGRITRPDQTEVPIYAHIEGCTADRIIYNRLKKKQDFQDVVLELIQTETRQHEYA